MPMDCCNQSNGYPLPVSNRLRAIIQAVSGAICNKRRLSST